MWEWTGQGDLPTSHRLKMFLAWLPVQVRQRHAACRISSCSYEEISDLSFPSIRDILGKRWTSPANAASSSAQPAEPPAQPGTSVQDDSLSVSEPPPLQRTGSKPLNIAQYAYSRASSVTTARSNPQPRTIVPSREKSTKPARESLDLLEIFTTTDLLRIRKCVSCSQSWTTRKTSAQKVKHIKTCAKKKNLTNETVQTLMRQEIEASPVLKVTAKPPPWISESNLPPVATQPEPTTLLEAAVKGDGAKKRGRRRPVAENVKELAETRPSILDRARQLLADPAPQIRLADEDHMAPPLTQPFGESRLASRFRCKPVFEVEPTQVYTPTPIPIAGPSRAYPAPPQETEDTNPSTPPPAQDFNMDDIIPDVHLGRNVFDERSNSSPQREPFFPSQHAVPSADPIFDSDFDFTDDPMFMHNPVSPNTPRPRCILLRPTDLPPRPTYPLPSKTLQRKRSRSVASLHEDESALAGVRVSPKVPATLASRAARPL